MAGLRVALLACVMGWACAAAAPGGEQGAGANLLTNGSFGQGLAGWSTYSGNGTTQGFLIEKAKGPDAPTCLALAGFGKSGCVYQPIRPVQRGAAYRFSLEFRSDMVTGVAAAEIRYRSREGGDLRWYQAKDAAWAKSAAIRGAYAAWTACDVEIVAPADERIEEIVPFFAVTAQSPTDTLWIRNARFAVVPGTATAQANSEAAPPKAIDVNECFEAETGNVILNPSFEFADHQAAPLYWARRPFTAGEAVVTDGARDKKKCLRVSNTGPDFHVQNLAAISVDYALPYVVEAWVKAEAATGESWLEVEMGRDGWRKRGPAQPVWDSLGVARSEVVSGSFGWRKLRLAIRPPAYTMYMLVRFVSRDNKGNVYLDGLYMNGYGAEPVEFILNQAGFDARGLKTGVVRTRQAFERGTFELLAADGRVAFTGALSFAGKGAFGGYYYEFDFTGFRTEGEYRIKASFDGGPAAVSPGAFKIRAGLYRGLAEHALQFFQRYRSGCAVPGWFEAAFLDDCAVYTERFFDNPKYGGKKIGHQDLTGGWFDAADPPKFSDNEGAVTWEMLRAHCLVFGDQAKANAGHGLAREAQWGADYVRKLYNGADGFWGAVRSPGSREMAVPFWKTTDNIPGTADDRIVFQTQYKRPNIEGNREVLLAIAEHVAFRRAAGQTDAELEPWITVLKKTFPASLKLKPQTFEASLIRSCRLMSEITGEKSYLDEARRRAAELEAAIREQRYLAEAKAVTKGTPAAYLYNMLFTGPLPFDDVYFLLDYAETFPAEELSARIRRTAEEFLERDLVAMSRRELSPIGHTWMWDPLERRGRAIASPNRNNVYACGVASVFAKAARVLKRRDYLDLAERNLAWITGRNPCAASCLVGVGWREAACYSILMEHNPGHEDSRIPGGICKGIGAGGGQIAGDLKSLIEDPIGRKGRLRGPCSPEGFTFVHSFPSKDCPMGQRNGLTEVWIRTSGAYLLACGEVERSLADLD